MFDKATHLTFFNWRRKTKLFADTNDKDYHTNLRLPVFYMLTEYHVYIDPVIFVFKEILRRQRQKFQIKQCFHYHIETCEKWPPFCGRHFKMNFSNENYDILL